MNSGRKVWSDTTQSEDEEPPTHVNVPCMIPGQGIGVMAFDYFGIMHTLNENSYLLYVQRKSEATH